MVMHECTAGILDWPGVLHGYQQCKQRCIAILTLVPWPLGIVSLCIFVITT